MTPEQRAAAREYVKAWKARRRETDPSYDAKVNEQSRLRRLADPDKARAAGRAQRAANLERYKANERAKASKARALDPDGSRAKKAAYRAKYREALAARQREWNAADPERLLGVNLKNSYGITLAEYDAMHAAQDGLCAICSSPGPSRTKARLCVDHDHATGALRALLCGHCNRGIGQLRDSAETCRRAAAYLELHAAKRARAKAA